MTENNVTRLDPMNTVVHYELLRVAHMLMVKKQNLRYWERVRNPIRPVGRVRNEVARQVSTFLVPLLFLGLAVFTHHLLGLLIGVPVAWFIGFALDRMLTRAISAKLKRDIQIDSGRYRAVMWLSKQMGMAPDEITLPVIYKMAEDFRKVDSKMKADEAQAEADRDAALAQRRRRIRAGAGGAAAAAGHAHSGDRQSATPDSDMYDGVPYTSAPGYSVNPASGFPMNPGGVTDTMGNLFGTNFNDGM
jgi:hypothetical protein